MLTVSMASGSTAAFFFSLALTFAVVESTAVATFAAVSFLGGVAGAGYPNRLGLAFDINSNLGTCITSATAQASGIILAHLQISVKTDDCCGLKGKACAVCKGIPIPELAKQSHANYGARISGTCTTLQTDCRIASSSIDKTLAKRSTKPSHRIFVLVGYDFCVKSAG